MASTSKGSIHQHDSSNSDSKREAKRLRFQNVNRRENRPQKYRIELEINPDFKGWLKPVRGSINNQIK